MPVPNALQLCDAVTVGAGVDTATASLSACSSGVQPTMRSSSDSTSAKVGRAAASAAQQRSARACVAEGVHARHGMRTEERARVGKRQGPAVSAVAVEEMYLDDGETRRLVSILCATTTPPCNGPLSAVVHSPRALAAPGPTWYACGVCAGNSGRLWLTTTRSTTSPYMRPLYGVEAVSISHMMMPKLVRGTA